jgi:hypothetical protein
MTHTKQMLCSAGKKGFAPQQPLQVMLTGPEITSDTIKPVFPKSCDGTYSFSSGKHNCTNTPHSSCCYAYAN